MTEEREIKLECLKLAGGSLHHAQQLFAWVDGENDFERGLNDGLLGLAQSGMSEAWWRGQHLGTELRAFRTPQPAPHSPGGGERPQDNLPEGFEAHEGGECPLEIGAEFVMLTRGCGAWNPCANIPEIASHWNWKGRPHHDTDIIAFKRSLPAKPTDAVETASESRLSELWELGRARFAFGLPRPEDDYSGSDFEARDAVRRGWDSASMLRHDGSPNSPVEGRHWIHFTSEDGYTGGNGWSDEIDWTNVPRYRIRPEGPSDLSLGREMGCAASLSCQPDPGRVQESRDISVHTNPHPSAGNAEATVEGNS